MNGSESGPAAKKVITTYNGVQHCAARREPHGNVVAMDCPYTGKGEEFSPGELVQAAIAGCMLLSMGAVAMRRELDIAGAGINVATVMADSSPARIGSIDITVTMPRCFADEDRIRLEKAADACPIKHSFDRDIPISVCYDYPE